MFDTTRSYNHFFPENSTTTSCNLCNLSPPKISPGCTPDPSFAHIYVFQQETRSTLTMLSSPEEAAPSLTNSPAGWVDSKQLPENTMTVSWGKCYTLFPARLPFVAPMLEKFPAAASLYLCLTGFLCNCPNVVAKHKPNPVVSCFRFNQCWLWQRSGIGQDTSF